MMKENEVNPCLCVECQKAYWNGYKDGFNEAINPIIREKILRNEPIIIKNIKPKIVWPEKMKNLSNPPLHDYEDGEIVGWNESIDACKSAVESASQL